MAAKRTVSQEVLRLRRQAEKAGRLIVLQALEAIATQAVTDAQYAAPVRQVFKTGPGKKPTKKMEGKFAYLAESETPTGRKLGIGRGARILVHSRKRSLGNKGYDLEIGRVSHVRRNAGYLSHDTGEQRVFGGGHGRETTTIVGRAANRTGRGSRPKTVSGYALTEKLDRMLTKRARFDLARGIGTHKISDVSSTTGGTASKRAPGTIVFGGALRDSVHSRIEPTEKGFDLHLIADAKRPDGKSYAEYVEYGTYKDYAQPFMRPAMKAAKMKLRSAVKEQAESIGLRTRG